MENSNTSKAGAARPSSTLGGRDRRQHPRQRDNRPAWRQEGSNAASVEIVDISAGGACFVSQRAMTIGKSVRLQVGHGSTQAIVAGVVVRQSQRPDGLFEVGLKVDELRGFEHSTRFPSRARLRHV